MSTIAKISDMTKQDRLDYFRHVGLIQRSEEHMLTCIESLRQIKKRKLYLWEYKTFKEFCERTIQRSCSYVYRLLEAEEVRKALPPAEGQSKNVAQWATKDLRERHTRELTRLPAEQRSEAIAEASRTAGKKEPTAAGIKAAVDKMLGKTDDDGELAAVVDGRGEPVTDLRLRPVFVAAKEINDAVKGEIERLKGKIEAAIAGPAGAVLAEQRQDIQRDRENMLSAFKFSRPWVVCTYCGGRRDDCKGCCGRGWLTKEAFDMAPKDHSR